MNIIIVGCGAVGSAICSQLTQEGHDITLVDQSSTVLNDACNRFDVFGVVGNGADISVMKKARTDDADLLIAVTPSDEINILCCLVAKKLGILHTVARVRNPEYSELMVYMKNELNLSLTINPELAVAKEIYRTLRFPAATKIDLFCRGRIEMAELSVDARSSMCGMTLNDLRSKTNLNFLVCAVLREGKAYIPKGDFVLMANDVICITIADEHINQFFKALGIYKKPVKDVLIVGGGRVTYYLEELLKKGKISSTVIESDKQRCKNLAEDFDCSIICDDGTKKEILLEEGVGSTDAFLALSSVDEENAIISMFAKAQNASKVITMISTMSYHDLFKQVGLESVVSPEFSTVSSILRYIRSLSNAKGAEIESLHMLLENKVQAVEFLIKDEIDDLTSIPLKELRLAGEVLVACIVRADKVIIPTGNDMILKGDTVIVVTANAKINEIKEILK